VRNALATAAGAEADAAEVVVAAAGGDFPDAANGVEAGVTSQLIGSGIVASQHCTSFGGQVIRSLQRPRMLRQPSHRAPQFRARPMLHSAAPCGIQPLKIVCKLFKPRSRLFSN